MIPDTEGKLEFWPDKAPEVVFVMWVSDSHKQPIKIEFILNEDEEFVVMNFAGTSYRIIEEEFAIMARVMSTFKGLE